MLFVKPERMSAWNLYQYTRHLAENRQRTERYEIAMWKKLIYPFAVWVMMALALPFAYIHTRSGSVGVKVFSGIMLGIFFHMLNSLFSHLGLLQNWQPLFSAILPSAVFLTAAGLMMWIFSSFPTRHSSRPWFPQAGIRKPSTPGGERCRRERAAPA